MDKQRIGKIKSLSNSLTLYPPYEIEVNEVEKVIYKRWSNDNEVEVFIERIQELNGDVTSYIKTFGIDLWENRKTTEYIYIM